MSENIGIFGGSFDPVHLGHLMVAQAAMEEAGLTRLFFVPTHVSPFKIDTTPTPPGERLRMLRLALAGKSKFEVDDQEALRGGVSYSIDTVRHYKRRFLDANLFYLIGADNLETLPQWREAEELANLVTFLVIPRPGKPSSTAPRPFKSLMLNGFPLALSSSQIRERVRAGLRIDHLVSPEVSEAIKNYRLYF